MSAAQSKSSSAQRPMCPKAAGFLRRVWPAVWFLAAAFGTSAAGADGRLGTIRDDVRRALPVDSSPEPDRDHEQHHHDDCDDDSISGAVYGELLMYAFTSPFWAPHAALDDDFKLERYFARFPYDGTPGYMDVAPGPSRPRGWSARLRTEYADEFGDLSRIGGHLLLSTTSRWGLDTEMSFLQESLSGGGRDELWIGDCNLVYRFAQGERMQWRTGLGFNWLDDPVATDFGFNFTYGMDFFPARPWVISATADWGTLGRAELFRFRTTAGVLIRGVEAYTGYEYLDIDRTQINSLLAGVRIWF